MALVALPYARMGQNLSSRDSWRRLILVFPNAVIKDETDQVGEADDALDKDTFLPHLENGQILKQSKIIDKQHFTEPPPRYSSYRLVVMRRARHWSPQYICSDH